MKKPVRQHNGKYTVRGNNYSQLVGSRRQVWNGIAFKTKGGLEKPNLFMNKWRRIVSMKKHNTTQLTNLTKSGWVAKKGSFGAVRNKDSATRKRRSARSE